MDEADEFGSVNIPNAKSFWVIENGRGIYFLSSRRDAITKFKHFTPYSGLKAGTDSVTDLGLFDEGYCSQVNSIGENLIVCLASQGVMSRFA